MEDIRTDIDTLASQIDKLSPSTREKFPDLIENLANHSAVLVKDEKGKTIIQYEEKQKLFWDASNANKIAVPKSEQEIKAKTEKWLEMLEYYKIEKPPSGVVLNKLKIHTEGGQYRENVEYEKTGEVLSRGNSAGDIVVVKDKGTGCKHALKTILIPLFRSEEIKAMVDLGIMKGLHAFPELYLYQIVANKVYLHMEILKNAITLSDVMNHKLMALIETNAALLKPFSLRVFHNLLEVVHKSMHEKGWTHRDLHSGNVMIQKMSDSDIEVKILDFGNACTTDSRNGEKGMTSDFLNALRIFSALYFGDEFNDQLDLKENWREKLIIRMKEMKDNSFLPEEHEELAEIFCIFQRAIEHNDFDGMMQKVRELIEKGPITNLMKEVVPILFPQECDKIEESEI